MSLQASHHGLAPDLPYNDTLVLGSLQLTNFALNLLMLPDVMIDRPTHTVDVLSRGIPAVPWLAVFIIASSIKVANLK